MSEQRDDTTDGGAPSRTKERPSGKYYYDDATGYEIYDPSKDDESDDDDEEMDGSESKDGEHDD